MLLIGALGVLSILYALPPLVLFMIPSIDPTPVVYLLDRLLVTPFALLLAGLTVCILLYLWLKFRLPAAVATLVLTILWGISLLRYLGGQDPAPWMAGYLGALGLSSDQLRLFLMVILSAGVLILPPLWFLRPLEGFFGLPVGSIFALVSSLVWLVLWLVLSVALREYRWGSILIVSLVFSGGVFLFGLYVASASVLPLPQPHGRQEALGLLRDYSLGINRPCYAVVDKPYQEEKIETRIPGNAFGYLAEGPGVVLSDCDHAIAISDGVNFKGLADPGVVFTGFADRPMQAIDLRTQLRSFTVDALTKDGIKVRVGVFIPFKIDSGRKRPELGEYLPHDKGAAFRAIHDQQAHHEENRETPPHIEKKTWESMPRSMAERILQNMLSEYDFDELYEPYRPGSQAPRAAIDREFGKHLAADLKAKGVQVVGWEADDPGTLQARIENIEPIEPRVYIDRVHSWQADWIRKVMLMQARGHADRLRVLEHARAETRSDLIRHLGRQLEELDASQAKPHPEVILNRFLAALEDLAARPYVRELLPVETWQAVKNMRDEMSGESPPDLENLEKG